MLKNVNFSIKNLKIPWDENGNKRATGMSKGALHNVLKAYLLWEKNISGEERRGVKVAVTIHTTCAVAEIQCIFWEKYLTAHNMNSCSLLQGRK